MDSSNSGTDFWSIAWSRIKISVTLAHSTTIPSTYIYIYINIRKLNHFWFVFMDLDQVFSSYPTWSYQNWRWKIYIEGLTISLSTLHVHTSKIKFCIWWLQTVLKWWWRQKLRLWRTFKIRQTDNMTVCFSMYSTQEARSKLFLLLHTNPSYSPTTSILEFQTLIWSSCASLFSTIVIPDTTQSSIYSSRCSSQHLDISW